jgi:hypothetical protein
MGRRTDSRNLVIDFRRRTWFFRNLEKHISLNNSCNRDIIKKLTVINWPINPSKFLEPEDLLTCSRDLANDPYPVPDESIPPRHNPFLSYPLSSYVSLGFPVASSIQVSHLDSSSISNAPKQYSDHTVLKHLQSV